MWIRPVAPSGGAWRRRRALGLVAEAAASPPGRGAKAVGASPVGRRALPTTSSTGGIGSRPSSPREMSHDDPRSSSTGARAGVDALSLDLLAHALAGVRDPRDHKSYRLASRAFARAEACPTASPLRTGRWPPSPLPRGSGSSSWTSASA